MEDKEKLYKKNKASKLNMDERQLSFQDAAGISHSQTKVRNRLKKVKKVPKKQMSRFERRYSELAMESKLIPERKRIDFVLVFPQKSSKDAKTEKEKKKLEMHEEYRAKFEALLRKEGFSIQYDPVGELMFVKIHCPFKRLCAEAEKTHMEMPIKGAKIEYQMQQSGISKFIDKHFETDDEADFVSAQFMMDRISMFENYENPTFFFRPALRSFLTYHILINLDIRTQEEINIGSLENDDEDDEAWWQKCLGTCFGTHTAEDTSETKEQNRKVLKKKGLPYLLMKKTYTDSFILHEDSVKSWKHEDTHGDDRFSPETDVEKMEQKTEVPTALKTDPRKDLDETWTRPFKFQPLWKVRNYFGEKIAFYFAWSGELIASLWIPTLFGLSIFIYGLVQSFSTASEDSSLPDNATFTEEIKDLLGVIKQSFDNDVTPFFALVICLWGTIFLEFWKRKNATLAYEWDVDEFEAKEPDRPQYFGIKFKKDPVTSEELWYYPIKRQFMKFSASASVLIFMISLVLISVVGVIVYRVIIDVDMCPNLSASACLVLTTVVSSVLNAVSILILGKLYDKVAVWLTDWENHRTETRYNDALIIKLFAFQFVNSYASCFYIAFFRGRFDNVGVFGQGTDYKDSCSGTCMSQLSFQVLILMLVKPFPKFFKDIIIPFCRKRWRRRGNWLRCRPCCRKNQVDEASMDRAKSENHQTQSFLERERLKPSLGDFTLGEYTEKVIQYGFLMLFAASFPLAPLLALISILIDIRVDAKRMLWWYRRPVAFIAQDIGMWYDILTFVNFAGVLSNGFLIAFTSSWGQEYTIEGKLWIVIGFEHIVFVLKLILAYMIPDVPSDVRLAIRREKYQIAALLEKSKPPKSVDYRNLIPNDDSLRHPSDTVDEDEEGDGRQQLPETIPEESSNLMKKRPSDADTAVLTNEDEIQQHNPAGEPSSYLGIEDRRSSENSSRYELSPIPQPSELNIQAPPPFKYI